MEIIEYKEALDEFLNECPVSVYERGIEYFKQGRIRPDVDVIQEFFLDSRSKEFSEVSFQVQGTYLYTVKFSFEKTDEDLYFEFECDCPASKPCKHMAAASFYANYCLYELPFERRTKTAVKKEPPYFHIIVFESAQRVYIHSMHPYDFDLNEVLRLPEIKKLLSQYRAATEPYSSAELVNAVLMTLPPEYYIITNEHEASLKFEKVIQPDIYVSLDKYDLIHRLDNTDPYKRAPRPEIEAFWVKDSQKKKREYPTEYFYINRKRSKNPGLVLVHIDDPDLDRVVSLPQVDSYNVFAEKLARADDTKIHINDNVPRPYVYGPKIEVRIEVEPSTESEPVLLVKSDFHYYRTDQQAEADSQSTEKPASLDHLPDQYNRIKSNVRANTGDSADFPVKKATPARLRREPVFYGMDSRGRVARRDLTKEFHLLENWKNRKIPGSSLRRLNPGRFRKFFFEEVPAMIDSGAEVYIESDVLGFAEEKFHEVKFEVYSSGGVNWFEGRLSIEGLSESDTKRAIEAFRKGQEYLKTEAGKWISLNNTGLSKIIKSIRNMGFQLSANATVKQIPTGSLLALKHEIDLRTESLGKKLESKIQAILETPAIRFRKPDWFKARLRPYQKQGCEFLIRRHASGIGAILADDMGLGKTVQALGFFSYLHEFNQTKKDPLFLVVCPMAAMSVWESESQKFAPRLMCTVWHGTERKSKKRPKSGLWIVSFGTLVKDIEIFEKIKFASVIIDEAQFAKNHLSQVARSLRRLNSKTVFCLTGTPLENHPIELWSLLDLIFPGYAGSRRSFQSRYKNPSAEDLDVLRRRLSPLVLRRQRHYVLKELPGKTEQNIIVPMTKKQSLAYEALRDEAQKALLSAGSNYLMVMLPYLMRLRRIACDPVIDHRSFKSLKAEADFALSGKLSYFIEQREEIEESSTGVLVFSQFTDVLDRFEIILKQAGSSFFRLDGNTNAKKRKESVKKFQTGEAKYFLISLKAGGSALTLHRADTVLILDPWWNPAAEDQAVARAHRMGQDRHVFVYRYISKGTVEEKVTELQKKKRELFQTLFDHNQLTKSQKLSKKELQMLLD